MLKYSGKLGLFDQFKHFYQLARSSEHAWSVATFNMAIFGFGALGDFESIEELLTQMNKQGFHLNQITYVALLRSYGLHNNQQKMSQVWQEACQKEMVSKPLLFTFFEYVQSSKEAQEVYVKNMSSFNINTYSAYFGALVRFQNFEGALGVLKKMIENEMFPTAQTLCMYLLNCPETEKHQKYLKLVQKEIDIEEKRSYTARKLNKEELDFLEKSLKQEQLSL